LPSHQNKVIILILITAGFIIVSIIRPRVSPLHITTPFKAAPEEVRGRRVLHREQWRRGLPLSDPRCGFSPRICRAASFVTERVKLTAIPKIVREGDGGVEARKIELLKDARMH
jgi:hypothetical protein